jgi:hypothetical protein
MFISAFILFPDPWRRIRRSMVWSLGNSLENR